MTYDVAAHQNRCRIFGHWTLSVGRSQGIQEKPPDVWEKSEFGLDVFATIYNHMVVYKFLDLTFAALSDPTRRSIVDRLTHGPATVNELAAQFAISQQAVSKHIAYLEMAHLIERQWQGRQNFCALKPETLREVAKWVEGYRTCWEKNFQRLDVLLAEMKKSPTQPKSTHAAAKSAVRTKNHP